MAKSGMHNRWNDVSPPPPWWVGTLSQLITFIFLFSVFFLTPFQETFAFQVVIDPGHGGTDLGTFYDAGSYRLMEKDVTLRLARQIANQLIARGVRVTLTRTTDQEVPLPARTALANRLGADIFISIHMNSAGETAAQDPSGVETFILNNATDASSRRLARLENSVIAQQTLQSPDQTDVALILKDLRLDGNLTESKRLACHIQQGLVQATSEVKSHTKRDRGVKQALFHVLLGADMPSILVEAGFLSNAQDRHFITSSYGQMLISKSVADAIDRYRYHKNKRSDLVSLSKCKIN